MGLSSVTLIGFTELLLSAYELSSAINVHFLSDTTSDFFSSLSDYLDLSELLLLLDFDVILFSDDLREDELPLLSLYISVSMHTLSELSELIVIDLCPAID